MAGSTPGRRPLELIATDRNVVAINLSWVIQNRAHVRTEFRELPLIEVPSSGYVGRPVPPVATRMPPTRRIRTAGTGGTSGGKRTFMLSP